MGCPSGWPMGCLYIERMDQKASPPAVVPHALRIDWKICLGRDLSVSAALSRVAEYGESDGLLQGLGRTEE